MSDKKHHTHILHKHINFRSQDAVHLSIHYITVIHSVQDAVNPLISLV